MYCLFSNLGSIDTQHTGSWSGGPGAGWGKKFMFIYHLVQVNTFLNFIPINEITVALKVCYNDSLWHPVCLVSDTDGSEIVELSPHWFHADRLSRPSEKLPPTTDLHTLKKGSTINKIKRHKHCNYHR